MAWASGVAAEAPLADQVLGALDLGGFVAGGAHDLAEGVGVEALEHGAPSEVALATCGEGVAGPLPAPDVVGTGGE